MTTERRVARFPKNSPYHPETTENILRGFVADADEPAWLSAMRKCGMDYLNTRGLPTPKLEGWKFTNIIPKVKDFTGERGRTKVSYVAVPGVEVLPLRESAVNLHWVRELIDEAVPEGDANIDPALWHLSNVYFRDGVSIDVPADLEAAMPLQILMECFDGQYYMVHTAVRLGANSSLTIIEDHRGTGKFWKNRLSHITLAPGAKLTHVRIQEDSEEAVYTQTTNVNVAKDATYNAIALYTGGAVSRNQVHVSLNGPGANCHLNGVALMRGTQHADTTILVEHHAPHCESKQNMRHVLDGQAHGVFQGKIKVHQPAQKTDGYQLSRALILSEGAEMDTKPELEIYADDVKCSHGATTGQLDEEPLFYMQSRGISRDEARGLLIQSFVSESLALAGDQPWHVVLDAKVAEWLAK